MVDVKNILMASCCVVLLSCDDPDFAGSDDGVNEAKRARIMERMDKDGDGVVSPDERAEAQRKRALQTQDGRIARLPERAGGTRLGQGDGPNLNDGLKKRVIHRFDADGDGVLNDAERAEARKAIQAKRSAQAD